MRFLWGKRYLLSERLAASPVTSAMAVRRQMPAWEITNDYIFLQIHNSSIRGSASTIKRQRKSVADRLGVNDQH
jgi:hypothetical protein